MKGIAFSVKGLLITIALTALGVSALVNASRTWVSAISFLTTLLLLTGVVSAIYNEGRRRAFAVGWSIFGGAYLLLAYAPEPYNRVAQFTQVLDYVAYSLERSEPALSRFELRGNTNLSEVERISLDSARVIVVAPTHVEAVGRLLLAWLFAAAGGFTASYLHARLGRGISPESPDIPTGKQ